MPAQGKRAAMSEEPGDEPILEEVPLDEVEPDAVEEVASDFDPDEEVKRLEDLDPKTPLFDGGPLVGQVVEWKKQHGAVYVTSFDFDQHYVWRPITRFEYRRLVKLLEQTVASGSITQAEANMNNEEAICELCILWPKIARPEMAGEMAGVASIISQEVMEASAFVAVEVRQL